MIQVHVRGLSGFQHDLEVSRDRLVEGVRSLMSELADETADDARARARRGSKRASASIRSAGPVVRAGDDIPWYGFMDFGGRVGRNRSVSREYIKGGRYLFPAVRDVGVINKGEQVVDNATKELR